MALDYDKVTFRIDVEQEDQPVRGNAMASGDKAADKEVEDEILRRLDMGDKWAWCIVIMTARFGPFIGRESLGGCSYKDLEDFKRGGYYEDMRQRALDDLRNNMEMAVRPWRWPSGAGPRRR